MTTIEHELGCSICARPLVLAHGHPYCDVHGVRGVLVGDTVRTGRTRARQFESYPKPEAFRLLHRDRS